MKRAFVLIRDAGAYPHGAVMEGLKAAGLAPQNGRPGNLEADDVLVTWTPWRNSVADQLGEEHKRRGGKWIVMENGYIKEIRGARYYAVGLNGYNGWGSYRVETATPDRWESFGLTVKDWRRNEDGHVLIVGQFGHADTRLSMPRDWPDAVISELVGLTNRQVVFRPKPSRPRGPTNVYLNTVIRNDRPLVDEIRDAWAVVIWNSKAGVLALLEGVPVFCLGPRFIAKGLTESVIETIEVPMFPLRRDFFRGLAWTQWTATEIERGGPFARLLE